MQLWIYAVLFGVPLLLVALAQRIAILDKIGVVVLAFATGLLFAFAYQPPDAQMVQQMADGNIANHLQPALFGYIGCLLLLTVVCHAVLCKLFRIDVDTFIITGTAAIMSVPFIPMVASSLKNKALLFPGVATAVMGYVIGNYLGIAMAYVIRAIL